MQYHGNDAARERRLSRRPPKKSCNPTVPAFQLAGDDGYRFRQLLIRDAAYDALPKAIDQS